jgi:hypothetical protein
LRLSRVCWLLLLLGLLGLVRWGLLLLVPPPPPPAADCNPTRPCCCCCLLGPIVALRFG